MNQQELEAKLTPELALELKEAKEYRDSMRHFRISPNHWCHRRYKAALAAAAAYVAKEATP